MKTLYIFTLLFVFSASTLFAQAQENQDNAEVSMSALLSYNFISGKNNLSNLAPEIFMGWNQFVLGKKGDVFSIQTKVGPYASTQVNVKDSVSFLPALMLPGQVGFVLNNYLIIKQGNHEFLISPLNFGFKLLSNFKDSSNTIIQHNYRAGLGYQYKDLFAITFQYSRAWHNLTSSSEDVYNKIFGTNLTRIEYYTVTLQSRVTNEDNPNPMYLFASWRKFDNSNIFTDLPNSKILTFGLRKSIDFKDGINSKRK